MCEPGRHADLWLTADDVSLDDLAGLLARAEVNAHDLRPATATQAARLGLSGRLWVTFETAEVR